MSRAIRRPHMVSAARKIFARSVLCELPAFGSALPTCRAGAFATVSALLPPCLPPNFRVIVMSCLTDFGSALIDGFALLSYFTLFAQLILCVALLTASPMREALPSNSRKPAGARLDRALWFAHSFVFLLHFVGRHCIPAFMPIIMNYEL